MRLDSVCITCLGSVEWERSIMQERGYDHCLLCGGRDDRNRNIPFWQYNFYNMFKHSTLLCIYHLDSQW